MYSAVSMSAAIILYDAFRIDMSDLVPPPDAKDAFETAHVEGLQSFL